MNLPPRPVDARPMRAGVRAAPPERSQPVSVVPSRYLVHETRAERALPFPVSLPVVAELLDTVRAELRAAGRSAVDAELSLDPEGRLVVGYVLDPRDIP